VPSAFLIWKKYAHVLVWRHESAYWLPLNVKYHTHIINLLHLRLCKLRHSRNKVEREREREREKTSCLSSHVQARAQPNFMVERDRE
jgi:hypothetical protein